MQFFSIQPYLSNSRTRRADAKKHCTNQGQTIYWLWWPGKVVLNDYYLKRPISTLVYFIF